MLRNPLLITEQRSEAHAIVRVLVFCCAFYVPIPTERIHFKFCFFIGFSGLHTKYSADKENPIISLKN